MNPCDLATKTTSSHKLPCDYNEEKKVHIRSNSASWIHFLGAKEVCNGGVACSLLKLVSLEKTVTGSLFHSGLHSGTIFLWKKQCHMLFWGTTGYAGYWQKKTKKVYDAKLIFWSFATFFVLTIFWSGAKQRICFRESMSVLNQNGRIQALGFLAR